MTLVFYNIYTINIYVYNKDMFSCTRACAGFYKNMCHMCHVSCKKGGFIVFNECFCCFYKNKKDNLSHDKLSSCTPAGGRTLDTLIKSQVLYQLSYKRKKIEILIC